MSLIKELQSLNEAKETSGYVSFYSDLGGLDSACMLASKADANKRKKELEKETDGSDLIVGISSMPGSDKRYVVFMADHKAFDKDIIFIAVGATKAECKKATKEVLASGDIMGLDSDMLEEIEYVKIQ